MIKIRQSVIDGILAHLCSEHPVVGCGLLLGSEPGIICDHSILDNVIQQYHEMDPQEFPLGQDRAYLMDPLQFEKLEARASESGLRILGQFHSQTGATFEERSKEPYFAEHDINAAMNPFDPSEVLHPQYVHMIVAVHDGRDELRTVCRYFQWKREREFPLIIPLITS